MSIAIVLRASLRLPRFPEIMFAPAFVRKAALIVAIGWPLCLSAIDAIDVPKLARDARPAVVLLEVQNENGEEIARGTGFFISADGTLVTNYHVIEGGVKFIAKVETGAFYVVKNILQTDKEHDLAILKADAKGVPFLHLSKGGDIEPGSPIAVIGSPLGLEGSVSNGIVSAFRGDAENRLLQITAPISPGSSGSPVLNAKGEVIGVVTAFLAKGQNVNIAVLAQDVEKLASRPTIVGPFPAQPKTGTLPLEKGATSDPDLARAFELLSQDDAVSALKLLNEVVKRYPDFPDVQFQLGVAYAKLGFNEDPIRSYRLVIKAVPDNWAAWANLVTPCLAIGLLDQAKTASETAIKINPSEEFAWRVRGLYFWQLRQPLAAVEAFEHSVKLAPDETVNWGLLASAYRLAGQTAKADAAERRSTKAKGAGRNHPNAPVIATPKAPDGELDKFIGGYLQATASQNIPAVLRHFGRKVDYYDNGVLTVDAIGADLRKLFARWPKYTVSNITPVTVTATAKNGSMTVSFNYDFLAEHPKEGRWSRGSTRNTATLVQTNSELQIVSLRQTILNRESSAKRR